MCIIHYTIQLVKVHFMRAVHRVAEKVCTTTNERNLFVKLASLVPNESNEENVKSIFRSLKGEIQADELPYDIQQSLPPLAFDVDTSGWIQAHTWVQWWTRPVHLSEYIYTTKELYAYPFPCNYMTV